MKASLFATILFIMPLLLSCSRSKYEKQTKLFNEYLSVTHHSSIPEELYNYLLIPLEGCAGCIHGVLQKLTKNETPLDNITIIISYSGKTSLYNLTGIKGKKNILIDSTGRLSRIGITKVNFAFIETKNNRINNISYFTSVNLDSLYTRLKLLPIRVSF